MKKIGLFSLLALGLLTLGTQVQRHNPTPIVVAPDVPPPDCMPSNCTI